VFSEVFGRGWDFGLEVGYYYNYFCFELLEVEKGRNRLVGVCG
jgi:hypothetical protein